MQVWSTTVLTPLSYDTDPTILISFDNAKYMFNVGENTNRAFFQSDKDWRRMRGIFLTQVTTERAGGLGGMLMSFADNGIDYLSVNGPPGLRHYIASMRLYLYRKQLDASTMEHLPDGRVMSPEIAYADDNIRVYAIPVTAQSLSSGTEPDSAILGSKRRRSPSPDEPSKIPRVEDNQVASGWSVENYAEVAIQQMFKSKGPAADPLEENGPSLSAIDEYPRKNAPPWFYKQLPPFSFSPGFPALSSLSYVVVGPRVRGRVDAKKLAELGVPRNGLRGKLTRGETIEFQVEGPGGSETRTVRPEDCMSKGDPPSAVIILDVPSTAHIPSVVTAFENGYRTFRSTKPEDLEQHTVRVVYHLCGPDVLEDKRYLEFMRGFPEITQHIVSSRKHSANPVTFTSHAFNQYQLNHLDPNMFRIPNFYLTPPTNLKDIEGLPHNVHPISATLTVPLRPAGPLQMQPFLPNDRFHTAYTKSQPIPESTATAFEKAKADITRHAKPDDSPEVSDHVKILTLGTGSAVPNKYRNVSSALIMTPGGNILLDAGEGTWGQLIRWFGEDDSDKTDVNNVLEDLKCIFVSHVHADHHMGLAKLLRQRKLRVPNPRHPLYLVSIRSVHLYLKEYSGLEDIGLSEGPKENGVIQVLSDALNYGYNEYPKEGAWRVGGEEPWLDINISRGHAKEMCRHLDLHFFKAISMYHRTKAFGVFMGRKDDWSIAFSGDTMPTTNLVKAASNATLLIHEATMGDDQEDLAKAKAHSTVGQAIQVARDMKAKNVLLTHFSARYPKMPPSVTVQPEGVATANQKGPLVTLAFDLVEMDLRRMWQMNSYLPAIEQCFKDTAEQGDADLQAMSEEPTS